MRTNCVQLLQWMLGMWTYWKVLAPFPGARKIRCLGMKLGGMRAATVTTLYAEIFMANKVSWICKNKRHEKLVQCVATYLIHLVRAFCYTMHPWLYITNLKIKNFVTSFIALFKTLFIKFSVYLCSMTCKHLQIYIHNNYCDCVAIASNFQIESLYTLSYTYTHTCTHLHIYSHLHLMHVQNVYIANMYSRAVRLLASHDVSRLDVSVDEVVFTKMLQPLC